MNDLSDALVPVGFGPACSEQDRTRIDRTVNSTAILLLVAGVLSVEGEWRGSMPAAPVGLRVGDDVGVVFYELKVREETRRVEVGSARGHRGRRG